MQEAKIISLTRVSPDVRQYTVELNEGKFDGEPGQHTVIAKSDGFKKPYSALTVDGGRAVFMIRSVAEDGVSGYMSDRKVGDTVQVEPSLSGSLHLENAERPIGLISTGTGLTPMMGILNEYVQKGEEDVEFIFGDKNTDQLLYKDMLEQYELLHNVNSTYVLSREGWNGREGYVQEHIRDIIDDIGEGSERDFYVCGVPSMVVATKKKLRELGVPEDRIYSEGWEDNVVN
jgi:NAD(P)H-flavin reductase